MENNGMVRALNLDEREIPVTIGGRDFILKQLPKVPLMRVLDAIAANERAEVEEAIEKAGEETPEETTREESMAQTFIREWEKAVPVIAMMFGLNPDKVDEWTEAVQFLTDNLAPMNGVKVFKLWWDLNEIDDFFIRCGRTLLHPRLEAVIKKEAERQLAEVTQDATEIAREVAAAAG